MPWLGLASTPAAVNMSDMFAGASVFNRDISAWNVSKVTNMTSMFQSTSAFNQNIGSWDVSNVTTMQQMFNNALAFNQNISGWNIQKVNNFSSMFNAATAFTNGAAALTWNANIGALVAGNIDMSYMFQNTTNFNQSLASWDITKVNLMTDMLNNCGINTANYDATLIGWAGQAVQNNVPLGATGRTYCAATSERNNTLVTSKGWTISGDSPNCPTLYSRQTGNWNDVNTWSLVACGGTQTVAGITPSAFHDVVICNTHTVTLAQNEACNNLTINSGGTLNPAGFNFTVNSTSSITGTFNDGTNGGTKTFRGLVTVNAGGQFKTSLNNTCVFVFEGGITNNATANTDFDLRHTGGTWFNTNNQTITTNRYMRIGVGGNGNVGVNVNLTLISNPISTASEIRWEGGNFNIAADKTVTNQGYTTIFYKNLFAGNSNSTWLNDVNSYVHVRGSEFMVMNGGVFNVSAAGNTVEYGHNAPSVVRGGIIYHNLAVGYGNKTITGGNITVNGNLTIYNSSATNLIADGNNINLKGNWINNSTFTAGTTTVTLDGTTFQTVGGSANTTFNNLTINNPTEVQLARPTTISNILALDNGKVILTNANDLTVQSAGTGAITRTNGWVQTKTAGSTANLVRSGTLGIGNNLFPVGTDTEGYAPVTLNYGIATGGGNHSVKAVTIPNFSPLGTSANVKVAWDISKPATANFPTTSFDWSAGAVANINGTLSATSQLIKSPTWTNEATYSGAGNTILGYNLGTAALATIRFGVATVATDYYTLDNTAWTSATKWSTTNGGAACNCYPDNNANVTIHIQHNTILDNASRIGTANTVIIENTNTSFDLANINPTNTFILNSDVSAGQSLQVGGATGVTGLGKILPASTFMDNTFTTVQYNNGTYTVPELIGGKEYQNLWFMTGTNVRTMTLTANRTINGNLGVGGNFTLNGTGILNSVPTTANAILYSGTGNLNLGTATAKLFVNGTFTNTSTGSITSSASTLEFANTANAIYHHARNGGVIPTATWGANSECRITGITNTPFTIGAGFLGQTFGNFTWNCAGQTATQIFNVNPIVQNTTSILNTGTNYLLLATGGNFTWTSRHFIMNPTAGNTAKILLASGPNTGTLALSGDFNNGITPAGTVTWGDNSILGPYTNEIRFNGTANQIIDLPNYVGAGANIKFTVNGTANTVLFKRTNFTSSYPTILDIISGTFAMNEATTQTLTIADMSGTGTLSMQNATHNLNLTGAVSFTGTLTTDTNPSTITYSGSAAQNVFGSPNYRNLVMNSGFAKTLQANATVNNNLTINNIASNSLDLGTLSLDLKGDLINNRAGGLTGTGTVTMNGTTFQTIGGSASTTFNNLTINNPNDVQISTAATVSNALAFTTGKVFIGNTNLIFNGAAANLTRTNGYVATNGTGVLQRGTGGTDLLFPVGSATQYQPVSLNNAVANASVRFGTPSPTAVPNSGVSSWYITNGTAISDITFHNPQGGTLAWGTSKVGYYGVAWLPKTTTYPITNDYQANHTFVAGANQFGVYNYVSQTLYSRKNSTWNDVTATNGTWSTIGVGGTSCDCTPNVGDNVVIAHNVTIPTGLNVNVGTATIQNAATLTLVGTVGFVANTVHVKVLASFT